MPRRKQGHFDQIRTSTTTTSSSAGGGGGAAAPKENLSRSSDVPEEDGDEGVEGADDRLLTALAASNTARIYLHKKFKKMETMSEDEFGNFQSSLLVAREKSTNVSLEALFQVTGHELEKIKNCSEKGTTPAHDSGGTTCKTVRSSAFEGSDEMEDSNCGGLDGKRMHGAGRHACPFCGLGCGKPSVLQKHIRAHTNERPYPCIPCGFAFKTKSNLYKHCKSRAHHLRATHDSGGGGDAVVVRWPENGSDSSVRPPDTDESSDSYDGGHVQSIDTMDVLRHSSTSLATDCITRQEKTSLISSSSIYKPKFHSVTHNSFVSGSVGSILEDPSNPLRREQSDLTCSRRTTPPEEEEVCFASEDNCLVEPTVSVETGESAPRSNLSLGAARLHKKQFHLRLEIPPFISPEVPTSKFTPTSNSSSSLSSLDRPTHSQCHSSSCASQDTKCPKLSSPEYLQQHISKLISQNAAIVDTLDPLWPRRYTRQSSIASSQNIDGELRSTERLRRLSEDVSLSVAPHLAKSKLARALLATTSSVLCSNASDAIPVLEMLPVESRVVEDITNSAVHEAHATSSENTIANSASRKSTYHVINEEKDGGIVKSLLTLNKTTKEQGNALTAVDVSDHPQNPEGSIIKDLLLKARTSDGSLNSLSQSSPETPSACVLLSGGSISIVKTAVSEDDSSVALYSCSICNIYFRSLENLEVHQTHYCRHLQDARPLQSADNNLPELLVAVDQSPTTLLRDGNSVDVFLSCASIHKPRGRPKGSKNRPKADGLAVTSGKQCRAHSKCGPEFLEDVSETVRNNSTYARGVVLQESPNSIRDILASRSPCLSSAQLESTEGDTSTDTIVPENSAVCTSQVEVVDTMTVGPILKKHLMAGVLSGDRSPPLKKRKVPVDVITTESVTCRTNMVSSNTRTSYTSFLKSLEHLSKNPMRSSSTGHLFGGEVQVCDGVSETRRLVVDAKALQQLKQVDEEEERECLGPEENVTGMLSERVVTTIAKPVHNSGGTVLQVHGSSLPVSTCIHVATVGRPLMATGNLSGSGAIVLSPSAVTVSSSFSIDIRHLKLATPTIPLVLVSTSDSSLTSVTHAKGLPTSTADGASDSAVDVTVPSNSLGTSLNPIEMTQCAIPDDLDSCLNILSDGVRRKMERISRSEVPAVAVSSSKSPSDNGTVVISLDSQAKYLTPPRPTSLPLRGIHSSMVGTTLVSPETPRPKKKYGQSYINGQYYTYLELKQSTKVYYCCIHRPQPMYVPQATDPKLSMYSVWQTVNAKDDPCGITPVQALGLYDSRHRASSYTQAISTEIPLQTTHSSYWTFRQKAKSKESEERVILDGNSVSFDVDEEVEEESSGEKTEERCAEMECNVDSEAMWVDGDLFATNDSCTKVVCGNEDHHSQQHVKNASSVKAREPKRVRIFEGGFKSNEDYTYVRGRGRGKYVCEECGIRCKKPSMLKKHIRTHTDVRPYTCKHCNFSFKTKGNLTKHMKSKAHHKKCVEMGVVPVPVAIDDVQIDEEALARQERIEHQRRQFANDEDSSLEEDDEEDDDDEYDEEEDDDGNEGYKEGEDEDDDSVEMEGQFDDAFSSDFRTCENAAQKMVSDQVVVARSLLDLSRPSFLGRNSDHTVAPSAIDNSKAVAGNGIVSWSPRHDSIDSRFECISSCRQQFVTVRKEEISKGMPGSTESFFSTHTMNLHKGLLGERGSVSEDCSDRLPSQDDVLSMRACCPSPPGDELLDAATVDQPIDLSMPHTRSYTFEEDPCGRNLSTHDLSRLGNVEDVDLRCCENVSPVLPKTDRNVYVMNHNGGQHTQESVPVCPPSPDDHPTVQCSLVFQLNRHGGNIHTGNDGTENLSLCSTVYVSKEAAGMPAHCPSPSDRHLPFTGLPSTPSTSAHNPLDSTSVKTPGDCPRPLTPIGLQKMPTYMQRPNEDGKCICSICNKTFSRPSQLRLHVNIHYFERPFRCDSCAISFRTKGHLQKHKRSVSHYNKVNMNLTFGTPTTDNPRPFKCADCKIAFRIHGHLAKHLRSKMHIMKLECLGKLPFGTYAEIERSGANLNEIDTTDCENSLESLQTMALKLVDKIPARQHWSRERTISGGSCDDQSDGVPYVESPGCGPETGHVAVGLSGGEGGNISPEFTAAERLVVWSQSVLEPKLPSSPEFVSSVSSGVKCEPPPFELDAERQISSRTSAKLLVVVECEQRAGEFRRLLGGGTHPTGSLVQNYEDISDDDDLEGPLASYGNLQSPSHAKSMQSVEMNETTISGTSTKDTLGVVTTTTCPAWGSSGHRSAKRSFPIDERELCGEKCPPPRAITQHSQLRPYVCDYCDAGFTTIQYLQAHLQMHEKQRKAFLCCHCQQPFECNADLKCHLESIHANHDDSQVR